MRYSPALKRRIQTGAHPMAFDPRRTGAKEVEGAEFWKPERAGDAILGRVGAFATNRIGGDDARSVTLEAACVIPKEGAARGYHSARVGVNTSLGARLTEADAGKLVAVVYGGKKDTPAGKMRLFRVFALGPEDYAREVLDALGGEDGRQLLDMLRGSSSSSSSAPAAAPFGGQEQGGGDDASGDDDDDLPF